ncbi:MAG: restriction endonuclease subunit S [Elusimicrobiota bacterium]|nr:restriction endonuclease subunit S [Elusimicrobiota bacterium]
MTTLRMGQEYKKTPIGLIPVHWMVKRLGDLVDIQIGGTPSRNNPDYWDTALRTENHWVAISDMKTRVIRETKERLTDLGIENSNAKRIPKGTVLMSFKLTIGKVAITGADLYTNEAIAAFLPGKEIDSGFLFYVLPMMANMAEADVAVKGRTLNKGKLQEMLVPVPPLAEQRRIAEILNTVDEEADLLTSIIGIKTNLKRGIFEALLPRTLPRKWKSSSIGECAQINAHSVSDDTAPLKKFLYVDISSVRPFNEVATQEVMFGDAPSRARRIVRSGDVLVSTVRPYLRAFARIKDAPDNLVASTGFAVLSPMENVDGEFLYQYVLGNRFVDFLERKMAGSNYPAVTASDVGDCPIPLPSLSEQVRIGNILAACDAEILETRKDSFRVAALREALVQALLRGKYARIAAE